MNILRNLITEYPDCCKICV